VKALVIAAFVTIGIGTTPLAQQQRSVPDMMSDMKARYGQNVE